MKLYVICPKISSNEEVMQEFVEGYGWDNVDANHVCDVKTDLEEIKKIWDSLSENARSRVEIRIINLSIVL